jgi:aminopeptidase N
MSVPSRRALAAPALFASLLIAFALVPALASAGSSKGDHGHHRGGHWHQHPHPLPRPAAPVITGTDPASPSKSTSPKVFGTAKGWPLATVSIFVNDNDCSGRPAARGSGIAFTHKGIKVGVPTDRTVQLTASVKLLGRQSRCSAPLSYTQDPRTYTAGAQTVGDPLFPQIGNGGYDAKHYDLRLSYDPTTNLLLPGTETTITARATQDLSQFSLDFQPLSVAGVTVDGTPAAFAFADTSPPLGEEGSGATQPTKLVVTPKAGLKKGATFTVVVDYSGEPVTFTDADESIEGWIRACYTVAGVQTCDGGFTVNEPNGAQGYFPSNNVPSDKATVDTHTTVPNGKTALGAGELASTVDNGNGTSTWNWTEKYPMATYLTTATVGDFKYSVGSMTEPLTGRTLPVYRAFDSSATPTQEAALNSALDEIPGQQNFLSELLGPFPFDSTGAVADRTTGVGYTLENQGKIHYSGLRISPGTQLHELTHQWMGDAVSANRWNDIWFGEGWATFMPWFEEGAAVAEEEFDGLYEGASEEEWTVAPDDLEGNPANLFSGFPVYERPAMTLEGYREIVGDARFFEFARAIVAKYGYSDIDYGRYVALAKQYSGLSGAELTELGAYFDQWLRQPAKPTILPSDF